MLEKVTKDQKGDEMNDEEEYEKRYRDYHKKRHREMAIWAIIALIVGIGLSCAAALTDNIHFAPFAIPAFFASFIIGIPLLIELVQKR